jgi:hypothetical protein
MQERIRNISQAELDNMSMIKYIIVLAATLTLLFASVDTSFAGDIVFETSTVRYVISRDGQSRSLMEIKSGRNLLVGTVSPFAAIRKGGRFFPATGVRQEGGVLHTEFGQSGISADYRISSNQDYLVIELVRVYGEGIEEIRLAQLRVGGLANTGELLNVLWDEKSAVCLMGLSDNVDSRIGESMLLSSVYPVFGMVGEKVALIAVQKSQFMDVVQKVEKDFKLPSPTIDGHWAKMSPDVRTSYLFTDLTETNADETIRYAKMAGFKYIMIYSSSWSSSLGSYQVNIRYYPRGEESLKAVIDKCHAAGLKVGMHMLTSFVGKNDALVMGHPDQRLVSDADATLANDIDQKTREIAAAGALNHFPSLGPYGESKDVRIDDEIIHYESIGGAGLARLVGCTRGYAGTTAVSHRVGAKIYHLAEREGSYLADLKTTTIDVIAERVAGLINRCGFDMIYFDGGEVNGVNGPAWYWAGQQQMGVWKRVKRDLLVQGSGKTHWTWHIFARDTSDDYAAVAPKQFLDYHKIPDYWQYHTKNFMPAELGWWGILAYEPANPATIPDEVEYYAVRMLALNSPVSLETSLAALKANGRSEEMLKLLGEYEQLRLSDPVSDKTREKLRTGEWHMARQGSHRVFQPVRYDVKRADSDQEVWVTNEFQEQPLKFRLEAVPTLAGAGDKTNKILLHAEPAMKLYVPRMGALMSGAFSGRVVFNSQERGEFVGATGMGATDGKAGKLIDLTKHRAFAIKLNVEGPLPPANGTHPVLNIQLESANYTYRDYYIDLDFRGERSIIIPEPTTERMLPEFRPAAAYYPFKAAMNSGFDYHRITSVNIRWMRSPIRWPFTCSLSSLEALTEKETIIKNPRLRIGDTEIRIPVSLRIGDYAEYWADGKAKVFDRNGRLLTTIESVEGSPMIGKGKNKIILSADSAASVKLTTILLGDALQF